MADPTLRRADGGVGIQNVINDDALLANAARAAGDYDNSTNLDPFCTIQLTVQYNAIVTPTIANGTPVAECYLLPGNGEASELFPNGGDAGLGQDADPQASLLVGTFVSVSPSITVDELLVIRDVLLGDAGNRFVVKNISGQEFDLTWQLDIIPHGFKSPLV